MYLVANFKAHAVDIEAYIRRLETVFSKKIRVILAPPYPYLLKASASRFSISSQDVSPYEEGPYTGEVTASTLKDCKVAFCLLGHSERRNLNHESNDLIKKKFSNCLQAQIHPILCVGETLEQHAQGDYLNIIKRQIIDALIPSSFPPIIAYEPVWAIGSGKTPDPASIKEVVDMIKKTVPNASVLYGGSVNGSNAQKLGAICDGLLVGSASKDVETFIQIIQQLEAL